MLQLAEREKGQAVVRSLELLKPDLIAAIAKATQKDGWAPLAEVGSLISKNNSSVSSRNYRGKKLGEFVQRQSYLKVKKVPAKNGSPTAHIYVRIK